MTTLERILCSDNFCTDYRKSIITPDGPPYEGVNRIEDEANFDRNKFEALSKQLRGKLLTVTTSQNPPLNYAEWENGEWVGKGFAFDFLKYMQHLHSFKYKVIVPLDSILGNQTCGLFGQLARKEADMAAALLPIIPAYNQFVNFSTPMDLGEWVAFMKRPIESATGSGLLAPFTFDVWILILVFLICMAPVVSIFIFIHKKLCPGEQHLTAHVLACLWFVYGAIVKQGSTMLPSADSTRLIFASWWIFITVLTAFYTANLTAFLTLSEFTLPVAEPEDIGRRGYTWVTDRGNAIEEAATNVLEKALKGSKGHYVYETKETIAYDIVKKKDYLYLGEKPLVEHIVYNDYLQRARAGLIESERCVFVLTPFPVMARARAFAYRNDFEYAELFDHMLQQMFEGGVVQERLKDKLPKATICPLNLKSIERQLRNTDFLLTYYVISTGFGMSFLSFVLEFFIGLICKAKLYVRVEPPDEVVETSHPSPPPYHTLFGSNFGGDDLEKEKMKPTDYWVTPSDRGKKNFVPARSPSAMLFQYTH